MCKYGVKHCKNIVVCPYKIHVDIDKIGKVNNKYVCLFNAL